MEELNDKNYEIEVLMETCKQLEQEKNNFNDEMYYMQEQLEVEMKKGEELEQLVEKMGEQLKKDEEFKTALMEEQIRQSMEI